MRKFLSLALAFFAIATGSLSAQDISNVDNLKLDFINELSDNSNTILEDEWSFFQDKENEIYLIDFETIPYNISEIVITGKTKNDVIWEESVFDLPVNAIYEIDYSKYPKGEYKIELRTLNGVLKKSIKID